ncbi:fumarate reductase flavoprotein subunit/urocanate reductase [Clostridium amylolyticum]|uniref:Urocanate reductase n=1 Tax=Clostridium amylolyticum TaxID=1121298 RepID=A0A1M6H7P4_9CLOT|nr:flavocytochrome c [Clostridium amylolyticum]SHJ18174.1 fumarate reductase flavoprotein subunit/urocanate reductase [Clostridium amylolyticum]
MKKFKKALVLLLSALMVFSIIGCGKTQKSGKGAFKPGTYTGEGEGIHGKIQVEVTVDENKITAVKVLKHDETPGVSDLALKKIPEDIVKYQSIGVDTIAGATVSSKGVLEAVKKALEKAGANIKDLEKKPEKDKASLKKIEKNVDVVVIGGGGSGLAAAVTAHQNGAKVLVLEKMPKVGGNTIISGAAYNAVDPKRQAKAGVEDSVDKHYTQTYEGGDKVAKPEMVRTFVENAYPGIEWLESMGMQFKDDIFTVLGALWPRSHKPVKPLGTGYIETYMNYIEKNKADIEIMVNSKATELIVENGKVVGVKAEGADDEIVAKASKGVVMATGGFAANVEMRNKYNKMWSDLTNIKTTNHVGPTGDGIFMAEKAGANLVGMEHIQLLPMGDPKTGSLSGNIEQGVENRIFVNKDGNRFVDEGARRDVMTKALFEQKDASMWVILDKHSYPTGDTKNNFNESIDELVKAGRAYKADTLEDLAKQIGANPDNLKNAVAEFNKSVETKAKDKFGRTLYKDKIDTAPFYAGARVPTAHHTMGGIEINPSAQVLDKNGKVIRGLYAAGETTGGIHGSNRLGGNALADTVVFGRIAGKSAAEGK